MTGKLVQLRPWFRRIAVGLRKKRTLGQMWPLALSLSITAFVAVDLAADLQNGVSATHIITELLALALVLAGVGGTAAELRRSSEEVRSLRGDFAGARADLAQWRDELQQRPRDFGAEIEEQLRAWGLSEAEHAVAWLILRGLSYKEAAELRNTMERTVRHQAMSIYRKAGLTGRAEMAAFFLRSILGAGEGRSLAQLGGADDLEQPDQARR